MRSIVLLCLSFYAVFAKHELYDGYVVYEVYPNNLHEIELLNDVVNDLALDIWTYANLETPGQIFVSEPQTEPFEKALKNAGISYKATIENIRELLELEDEQLAAASASISSDDSSRISLSAIYDYEQVSQYLAEIARMYPNVTRLVDGGSSLQGRRIQYLEISTTNFNDTRKPVIMLQALLHAREWITLPPALYAIHKLVVDVTESDVRNNIDWIVMPIANPDGYTWTRTNARLWRKNRRNNTGSTCLGVDLNRNFNVNFGTGSSTNPCSDTFHGTGPESEPETRAVVDVLTKYRSRMAMYADIHSHGSMILYGWGNGTLAPNALTLNVAAVRMAQAIDGVKWPSKPNYRVGNIVAILRYTSSGSTSDYAQIIGIPYSYTYELPSYLNGNGFLVDPNFISQASYETWVGIVAGARYILGN